MEGGEGGVWNREMQRASLSTNCGWFGVTQDMHPQKLYEAHQDLEENNNWPWIFKYIGNAYLSEIL